MITDLEPDTLGETKNAGSPDVEDRGHRARGDRPLHSHSNPKEAHVPFAPPDFAAGKAPLLFQSHKDSTDLANRITCIGKPTWWHD